MIETAEQPYQIEIDIPRRAFLPCYWHLLENTDDINLLWGGRDSGKSYFIASRLIMKCLLLGKDFRCIMVKATENTIKDSQWQTIKDIIEAWGLEDLFRFKISPLSIICVNGGRFIARGCDDSKKLKSIKDPSDVWYEEGNQITLDDFITVSSTLRSNTIKCQQWFSFNPECEGNFEDFWIYKTFYENYDNSTIYSTFNGQWVMDLPGKEPYIFTYTSTHTTYHNNPKCTPQRQAFLEKLAELNPYYYIVYTLGRWGRKKNDDPFCYTFKREKHLRKTTLDRRYTVKLSFDFNLNPITCGVYQDDGRTWIRGIESISLPTSDIYKLTSYVDTRYKGCVFEVTGDASGKHTTALVQDGINYYTVIKAQLRLAAAQLKVPTVNPKIEENRVLVNAIFQQIDVALDPDNCKPLIFDLENVSVTDMGKIDKGDRKNPKKRADSMDHWRYYLNRYWKHILKTTK